jgi:hypothetical protein
MLVGNTTIVYDDLFLILIPIVLPLFLYGIAYLVNGLFSTKRNAISFVTSLILTIIIFVSIIKLKVIKNIDAEDLILLGCIFMPAVSILSNIIELFMHSLFDLIVGKIEKVIEAVRTKIINQEVKTKIIDQNLLVWLKKFVKSIRNGCRWIDLIEIGLYLGICIIVVVLIDLPGFYAALGSYYGLKHPNNQQVISYLQDNVQKYKIGNIVGCKDGNYYISEYPNNNLVILKSTQAVVETYVTGWCNVENKWYYFDLDGKMLKDRETPDGYKFDKNGAWIK